MENAWTDMASVLACPYCTYEGILASWYFTTILKFLAVIYFAFRIHLDPVRIVGLVALFEIFHFKAWRVLLLSSDPIPGVGRNLEEFAYGILVSGIPVIFLVWGASYLRYFQNSSKTPLRRRNLVLLVPVFFVISMISHS